MLHTFVTHSEWGEVLSNGEVARTAFMLYKTKSTASRNIEGYAEFSTHSARDANAAKRQATFAFELALRQSREKFFIFKTN